MPTIEENKRHWSEYDWSRHEEEWSEVWGNCRAQWHVSLHTRVDPFLRSANTILEIAPGFGRFTQFLKDHCHRLVIVDLTERCIEACRERFRDETHIEYHTNDGRSLPMVADHAIDFAFSFDSLVHVEIDEIHGYLSDLSRVLRPSGVAFLHHSNVGAFIDQATGDVSIENEHWRATSVSAHSVRAMSDELGLACFFQEIVNWGGPALTDCLSLVTPKGSSWERPMRVVENPEFMDEAIRTGRLVEMYSFE